MLLRVNERAAMIEIKRILCPIDYSEFSRHAFDHAIALAQWYGASVTAVFVLPQIASLIPAGDPGLYPPFVFTADDLQQFRANLDVFVAGSEDKVKVETRVVEGSIAGEIAHLAQELPADLLVMGTHGRSGFDRLMLGSVTEKMLRNAPCPVLTVPSRVSGVPATPIQFTRILCPVDFSPSSFKALQFAESLAEETDAHLRVMHVLEPASVFEPVPMGGGGAPPVDPDASAAALRHLRGAITKDARIYSQVTETVTVGKAYREILREAAEQRSDLIVIGAHGGRVGSGAFGSTTNHVVREAGCPVLSLHA
jgi:nucleotide-binding universal stress UspA family protein